MGLFDKFKRNKKSAGNLNTESNKLLKKAIDDIHHSFSVYDSKIEEDTVILSKLNVTIKPIVINAKQNMITTGYYVNSTDWDRGIFEMCSGLGKDDNAALGMAQASFVFSLMDCVTKLQTKDNPVSFESEFNGHTHKWNVYKGNILSVGSNKGNDVDIYWNALKEHIAKRLGNQKLCYVKVFASYTGTGEFVGECRVNNLISDELSEIVKELAKNLEGESFTSQKQFFIFEQERETCVEYPYNEKEIVEYTKIALQKYELWLENKNKNKNSSFTLLQSITADESLATEIMRFIPDICAEKVFSQFKYPETLSLGIGDDLFTCYKTQLYSYSIIYDALYNIFTNGTLKNPDKVTEALIYSSNVNDIAHRLAEKGKKNEQSKKLQIIITYTMNDGYVPR